jgi:hypothetical protein
MSLILPWGGERLAGRRSIEGYNALFGTPMSPTGPGLRHAWHHLCFVLKRRWRLQAPDGVADAGTTPASLQTSSRSIYSLLLSFHVVHSLPTLFRESFSCSFDCYIAYLFGPKPWSYAGVPLYQDPDNRELPM